MIRHDLASFAVYGGRRTVAEVTALMGLQPNAWGDVGEPTPAGRAGRGLKPEYLAYSQTYWSLSAEADEEAGLAVLGCPLYGTAYIDEALGRRP